MRSSLLPERIDFTSRLFFEDIIERALSAHPKVLYLDFGRVRYIDSGGLGLLLLLNAKAKNCRFDVVFLNVSEPVNQLLEVAHFHKMFEIQKV